MFNLETPRLLLVGTPLHVIETRLERESFDDVVSTPDGELHVTFPAEWPGDALVVFPMLFDQLRDAPNSVPWGGTIIDKVERTAVGQISFKSLPDASGTVEVGYGVNPSYEGRGYATEATRALVGWALTQPGVTRVTAECLESNVGSVRVLEKAGFAQIGERFDEEEGGRLILWERRDNARAGHPSHFH